MKWLKFLIKKIKKKSLYRPIDSSDIGKYILICPSSNPQENYFGILRAILSEDECVIHYGSRFSRTGGDSFMIINPKTCKSSDM